MSFLVPFRSKHREDAELNLIPLIDIMSVLVAFLLVYSSDVELVQNSKGVEVPMSSSEAQPKQSVLVMINQDSLFVQGELVASTAELSASKTLQIEALKAVLSRPMASAGTLAEQQEALRSREITVLADKSLPYEIVRKVMATCTSAAYGKLSLAVLEKQAPIGAARVSAL
jgi:biopolymer transport protein TolR